MRYIDADEFRVRINHYPPEIRDIAKKELRYTKTADVVPVKRGKWMHDSTGANFCSECGMYPYDDGEYHMVWHAKFCPNCGANMEGENE